MCYICLCQILYKYSIINYYKIKEANIEKCNVKKNKKHKSELTDGSDKKA